MEANLNFSLIKILCLHVVVNLWVLPINTFPVKATCDYTGVEYIADDKDECHYWLCVHGIQYGAFPCLDGTRVPEGAVGPSIHSVCKRRDYDKNGVGTTSGYEEGCPRRGGGTYGDEEEEETNFSDDTTTEAYHVNTPVPYTQKYQPQKVVVGQTHDRNQRGQSLHQVFPGDQYFHHNRDRSSNVTVNDYFTTTIPTTYEEQDMHVQYTPEEAPPSDDSTNFFVNPQDVEQPELFFGQFRRENDQHIFGGTLQSEFVTESSCVQACQDSLTTSASRCLAVDFDRKSSHCFHHYQDTACHHLHHKPGCVHYTRTDCWYVSQFEGFHATGGVQLAGGINQEDCLALCHADPECLAVDYNSRLQTCWVHRYTSYCSRLLPRQHVTHFKRITCYEGRLNNISSIWPDFHVIGGRLICNCSLDMCLDMCLADRNCAGVDYNNVTSGCYRHSTVSVCTQLRSKPNCTHFKRVFCDGQVVSGRPVGVAGPPGPPGPAGSPGPAGPPGISPFLYVRHNRQRHVPEVPRGPFHYRREYKGQGKGALSGPASTLKAALESSGYGQTNKRTGSQRKHGRKYTPQNEGTSKYMALKRVTPQIKNARLYRKYGQMGSEGPIEYSEVMKKYVTVSRPNENTTPGLITASPGNEPWLRNPQAII